MRKISLIILFFAACSTTPKRVDKTSKDAGSVPFYNNRGKDISNPTNTLNGKTETLELYYIAFDCACANWVTPADLKKYAEGHLHQHCIFIEPANKSLEIPSYFESDRYFIRVTGQFYINPDYPKGTIQMEEPIDKAKVFRYTKIEVLKKTDK